MARSGLASDGSTTPTWTVFNSSSAKPHPTMSIGANDPHHSQHATTSSSVSITRPLTSSSIHRENHNNGSYSPHTTRSSSMDGDGNSSVASVTTPVPDLRGPSSPARSRSPSCRHSNISAPSAPSAASLLQAVRASISPGSPTSQSSGSGAGASAGGVSSGITVPHLYGGSAVSIGHHPTTVTSISHSPSQISLQRSSTASTYGGSTNGGSVCGGSKNDQKKKRRKYECDYDVNPTQLYRAIERRKWNEAMEILDRDDSDDDDDSLNGGENHGKAGGDDGRPEIGAKRASLPASPSVQAATWVVRKERDGRLRWRLLPLHAAVIFHSPLPLIESLLLAYPDASRYKDDQGMLPLHLAFRNDAADDVITELIASYPPAVTVRDRKGRDPLDCAIQSRSQPALSKRGTLIRTYAEVAVACTRSSTVSEIQGSMDRRFRLQGAEHAAEMERVKMGFDKQILERIEQVGHIEREMASVRAENQQLLRKLAVAQRGERELSDRATDLGRSLQDSRQEIEQQRRRYVVELRRVKAVAGGSSVENSSSTLLSTSSTRLSLFSSGGLSTIGQIDELEDECSSLRKKLERMKDVVRDAISHQDDMAEKLVKMELAEKERVQKLGELFKIEESAMANTSKETAKVRDKTNGIREELESLLLDSSQESFSNDEENYNPANTSSEETFLTKGEKQKV